MHETQSATGTKDGRGLFFLEQKTRVKQLILGRVAFATGAVLWHGQKSVVRTTSILTGVFFISILGFDMCSENNCFHGTSAPVTALVTLAATPLAATQKREEEAGDRDVRAVTRLEAARCQTLRKSHIASLLGNCRLRSC